MAIIVPRTRAIWLSSISSIILIRDTLIVNLSTPKIAPYKVKRLPKHPSSVHHVIVKELSAIMTE